MKKIFFVIAALSFTAAFAQHDALIPVYRLRVIADDIARNRWGMVSGTEPLAYYNALGEIIGYRFDYAIGKAFSAVEIAEMASAAYDAADYKTQWGIGRFGNIFLAARMDMDVVQSWSGALSPYYANSFQLEKMAADAIGGQVGLKKAYFLNFQDQWFCYSNGVKDIYIKIFPRKMAVGEAEFLALAAGAPFFSTRGDFSATWQQYLDGNIPATDAQVLIPNADHCPYYDWSYGCSPTAAAMLLGYWDRHSLSSSSNYGKLIDFHFQRYDGIQNETDYQVPNANKELAIAMNTDTVNDGGTDRDDIVPGYTSVCNSTNGYSFTNTHHNHGTDYNWYFSKIQSEVDADRPVHISIPNHSECAVGYDVAANEVGVHNTWWQGIDWISKTQLERVYTIVPGGAMGVGVEINSPDGDKQYNHNGNGEDLYAGDVWEITWTSDYQSGAYARLYYNTDANGKNIWSTITSNTDNDGLYDWVIPAGLNSQKGRIKVAVYNSSNVLQGDDGSLGNFIFHSGGSLYTLTSDYKVNTATNPDYYQFNHTDATWCALGVRANTLGDNWDIRIFDDAQFGDMIANSAVGAGNVDFVVMDGRHSPDLSRGVKVEQNVGTGLGSVEYEGSTETFTVGTAINSSWPGGDVVEMWDTHLIPGIYKFVLDVTTGNANLDIGLFGSSGSAYYAGRTSAMITSATGGAGGDESFTVTITSEDDYGLCVWANDANTAAFTIRAEKAGTWEGSVSSSWSDPLNWSADYLPTTALDVTIASPVNYSPVIETNITAYCHDLNIITSGDLNQQTGSWFHVHGDFNSDQGIFTMQGTSYLYFSGSGYAHWDDDNMNDIYRYVRLDKDATADEVDMWQHMNIGGNLEIREGTLTIDADWTLHITGTMSNALEIEDGGKFVLQVGQILDVDGGIEFEDGSQLDAGGGEVYCGGSLAILPNTAYNIAFALGSFHFDGSTTAFIDDQDGSLYFNNLSVNKSAFLYIASHNLDVNLNINIISGTLSAYNSAAHTNYYNIHVGGNWTNSAGVLGFEEAFGTVFFDGGNYHQYCSTETFYRLCLNKPSGGALRVNGGTVVCEYYDWSAGAVDVLAGTFTANDLVDNGLYGAYYLNTGGTINLTNDDGYVDLDGELHIYGGNMNIFGGTSESFWPYAENALIEMSGGVIDFKDRGILIYNTGSYSLTENITGGTIRTVGGMRAERSDFTPAGGTVELYGTADVSLHTTNNSNLFNITISKSATDDASSFLRKDVRLPGNTMTDGPLASSVNIDNILTIDGDFILNNGSVNANANTVYLSGDWTNNAGQANFIEGTSTITFKGSAASNINNAETFYDLSVNKTYSGFSGVSINQVTTVLGNLVILDGTMELNDPANLSVKGNIQISADAGLNANDLYGPQISVGGNWYNSNTGFASTYGFDPGEHSTVLFNGTVNQTMNTLAATETFNNLTINKVSGLFRPADGLTCLGNVSLNQGTWYDNVSGLTHTVYKNFTVLAAAMLNTITYPNTFVFAGPSDAVLDYQSSSGYFRNIVVNKAATDYILSVDPDQQALSGSSADLIPLSQKLTLLSTASCQLNGSLTIQEGTLDLNGKSFLGTGNVTVEGGGYLKAVNNSLLAVGTDYKLEVQAGGTLEAVNSTISHTGSGNYAFDVLSGASIIAENSKFYYLGINGLYLHNGAIVDATHSFHNCTFQYGVAGVSALMTANNAQMIYINNAHFPANTWSGQKNVWKGLNTGHITFIGADGPFAGPAFEYDPFNLVDWLLALSASPVAVPSTICAGTGAQLNANASGGLPGYTYAWSPATGLSATNIADPVASPAVTTTYSVTVSDSFGNSVSQPVTVTVISLPVVNINSSSPNLCLGSTAILTASGASTYMWNQGLGSGPVKAVAPAITTTYTVTGTDTYGCSSFQSINQVVVPLPVANAGTDITIPYGASTTLNGSASGGNPSYSFAWSPAAGLSSTIIANPLASPVSTTTYTLTVTDIMSCQSTDAVTITVLPAGFFSISGTLSYDDALPNPLSSSTVILSNAGGTVGTAATGISGAYTFSSVSSGEYTLTGATTKPWGGINATDALAAMKHFVHLITLTGLRLQASDVDASGLTNSNDALMIMKRFVNIINSFPAGDWLFQVLPVTVLNANITQNIRGLCYGDLDASYVPPLSAAELIGNNGLLNVSNVFDFPVITETRASLSAVSMIVEYPDDLISILDVKMPRSNENLFFTASGGVLRIAWASLEQLNVNPGESFIKITARLKPKATSAFSPLQLLDYHEMADIQCTPVKPFSMSVPLIEPVHPLFLGMSFSNPVNEKINLKLDLPEDGILNIWIFDEPGRQIKHPLKAAMLHKGSHQQYISLEKLSVGTYVIKASLQGYNDLYTVSDRFAVVR